MRSACSLLDAKSEVASGNKSIQISMTWSETKNRSWSWVLQVWCFVLKHGLVMLVVIMIFKDTTTFQVLFIVPLFLSWNITTVEINSGVHLLKS